MKSAIIDLSGQTSKATSKVFWVIITLIPIVGLIIGLINPVEFYQTQDIYREKIMIFGIFAPLFFIALQVLQVVITPINHYSVGVAGGFLFGPFLGTLYNYIGRLIGHVIAFFIARLFGRKIAQKFISQKTLKQYDNYVSNKSLILFLIYFLPVFPDDEISYLAGLSKMKFKMFFIANIFGQIGGSLGLAYAGSGINTKDALFWIITIITLAGFPVFLLLTKKNKQQEDLIRPPTNTI